MGFHFFFFTFIQLELFPSRRRSHGSPSVTVEPIEEPGQTDERVISSLLRQQQ